MVSRRNAKNQLTLPESAVRAVGGAEYFEVEVRGGQIALTPVRVQSGDAVRERLAALQLTPGDVTDAVRWARPSRSKQAT